MGYRRQKRDDDPVEAAVQKGDDVGEFLAQVKNLCRFSDVVVDGEDFVKANDFERCRTIAMLDLFSDMTLAQKAGVLGLQHESAVVRTRNSAIFPRVKQRIIDLVRELARPLTMMEAAERFEPILVRESLHVALTGKGRDKAHAVEEFTGRLSAKKGRDAGKIEIRLPPGFIEQIQEAQKIATQQLATLPPAREEKVIDVDASVVPVPEYADG